LTFSNRLTRCSPLPLAFTLAEFESRLEGLRERLRQRGVAGMLIHTPENIYYLSGFQTPGYYAYQTLLVPEGRTLPPTSNVTTASNRRPRGAPERWGGRSTQFDLPGRDAHAAWRRRVRRDELHLRVAPGLHPQRERFDLAPAGVGAPAITFADSAAQPLLHKEITARIGQEPPTMGYVAFQYAVIVKLAGVKSEAAFPDGECWVAEGSGRRAVQA
jgi:Creatinase/Prolidase N-terminal domain